MYRIAQANEYIAITGLGIQDVKIAKKAIVLPVAQRYERFNIIPVNYSLNLSAMSAEKLEFTLPAVFTIGPKDDQGLLFCLIMIFVTWHGSLKSLLTSVLNPECLKKYARLLASSNKNEDHIQELVRGVIEGETRVITAGMTMEEIFKERKFFKELVIKNVQSELDQFGLFIYNANVKQLQDTQGSEYFQYLRLKTHEGAVNQAKVDVAEAKFKGNVGEKEREGMTRKENARIEASTVIFENERQVEMCASQTAFQTKKVEFENQTALKVIETSKQAAMRDADLQKEVEVRRAAVELERCRADLLAKAKVDAEAVVASADAQFYKTKVEVDAQLYAAQKQAEGIRAMYEAQAVGIERLTRAFEGDTKSALSFLMLEKGLYTELAKSNAAAIQGLNPKITVWNTGSGQEDGDEMRAIRDIFQSLPPLLTTINEQTGISPPAWMAALPAGNEGSSKKKVQSGSS
eukprot:jgi/Hompol1/6411/HPOL_000954-RA